jgi:DNA-binding beta-propeller fold protein YncE
MPLAAEEPSVSGPVLGYAYDASTRLARPMFGLPGAASFGKPVVTSLTKAVVSPAHDYMLGIDADGQLVRADLSSGAITAIPGAKANADQLIVSPSGSAAVAYQSATGTLQIIGTLHGTPEVTFEDQAMGEPTGLAVSDDGEVLLYGVTESTSTALYRGKRGGGTVRLGNVGAITANTFRTQTQEAAIAQSDGAVVLVGIDGAVSVLGHVEQPSAIAVSPDNTKIFVASAQLRRVSIIGTGDQQIQAIACDCAPNALERVNDSAVFRLTGFAGSPMWLLDATGPAPVTFFVPAPEPANE